MSKQDLINKLVDITLEQGPPSEVGGKIGNEDESKEEVEEIFAVDTPEIEKIEKQVDLLIDNALQNDPSEAPEEELTRAHHDIAGYGNPEDEEKEYPPGPQDPDDLGDYPEEPMEEPIGQQLENILGEKGEYQVLFKRMMDKEGIASIKDLTGDKKKSFFNKVDAAWKGKGEKKEEIKEDYKTFFRSMMDRFGISNFKGMSTEKKREFFGQVGSEWRSKKKSENLENIKEDFASSLVVGAIGGFGAAFALYLKNRKIMLKYCEKKNIKDRKKCKYKWYITNNRKLLILVNKGMADCKNQKNPTMCKRRFSKMRTEFENRIRKYQTKLQAL